MVGDVGRSRVVWGIAPDVGLPLALVHMDVVDEHFSRELHSFEINLLPVRCQGLVSDELK